MTQTYRYTYLCAQDCTYLICNKALDIFYRTYRTKDGLKAERAVHQQRVQKDAVKLHTGNRRLKANRHMTLL